MNDNESKTLNEARVKNLTAQFFSSIMAHYKSFAQPTRDAPLEILNALAAVTAYIVYGCGQGDDPDGDRDAEDFFHRAMNGQMIELEMQHLEQEKKAAAEGGTADDVQSLRGVGGEDAGGAGPPAADDGGESRT